ncbi:MAG: hypothetical protein Q9219_003480 [cf. Caloplaca sp. 3 TL-2023]
MVRTTQSSTVQPTVQRVGCTVPGCDKKFNRKEHLNRHLNRIESAHTSKSNVPSDAVNGTAVSNVDGQIAPTDISTDMCSMSAMIDIIPNCNDQNTWPPQPQDSWSAPATVERFDAAFPSGLGSTSLEGWPEYSVTAAQVSDSFAVPPTADAPFILPTAHTVPHNERLERMGWTDAEPHPGHRSSAPTQSPVSSLGSCRASTADFISDLKNALPRDLQTTSRLVHVFFSAIHPHWPILHAPTFRTEDAPHELLGVMLLLSGWLQDEPDHLNLAPLVFDAVTATLLGPTPSSGSNIQPAELHTLQALLLSIVYIILCHGIEGMLARAVHLNGILVSHCRHQGVFNGQYANLQAEDSEDSPFATWLAQEQIHRLAFSALRIDAYLSLLVDHPPSVRYQELSIPLPKSTRLWAAATEDERRKQQWYEPAGREKARFCFLVSDALDPKRRHQLPYHLAEIDYHLGLCSFQAGIWETAHEAHRCEFDELTANARPRDHVAAWRSHLDLWRANMENNCQLWKSYYAASEKSADYNCAPLSIILWHYSNLVLHAPLQLLQGQACCFKCRSGMSSLTRKNQTRYRRWIDSSCSRIAVWNAAQIVKVVVLEFTTKTSATRLRLNPLAIAGLLKSAIVVCSYASYTRACPECINGPPMDLVDLFDAADDDDRLTTWKQHGRGIADWGPSSTPICRCRVSHLASWFLGLLAKEKIADAEFKTFLDRLGKV